VFAPNRRVLLRLRTTCISPKEAICVLEQEHLERCFSMKAELAFERTTPAIHSCQGGEKLLLLQSGLFS
jgi:hypothetical protein